MSVSQYSNNQIEVANLLNSVGKDGQTVPPEIIDEILHLMEESKVSDIANEQLNKHENEVSLRLKIMEEQDWRKKAALCALLISKSLE